MSESGPAAVMRAFLHEVWNKRDLDAFAKYVARDMPFHGARGPTQSYQEYLDMATDFQSAFPDLHFEIRDLFAEGDMVAARLVITGTQKRPWRGQRPAAQRTVRVVGQPQARVASGKIVEFWQLFDELGLLHQAGHISDHSLLGPHNVLVEETGWHRTDHHKEMDFDREEHIRRPMDAGLTREQAQKHADEDMRGR